MAGDAPGTAPENPARPGGPPAARLALYRRYRPATFAEVRGQEHVTEPLRQALRNDRIHHAYLFSGPRGCGKTSSARILARSLNCVQGPTPDPCGVCESCVALAPSGPGSIDVIEIDAASHGGVDDARDLRERAFYAPVSGRFKVYIIDEAHMVTREGFNALLKLVEEPPPHLKFVFATTEPEKVIPTIRSRTHHYPFRLVPPAVLRTLLEEILAAEGVSYQPSMLPLVVRAGAGSVRDSLSVLDQLLAGAGEEGLTYERTVALLGYTDDSLLDEMVDALAAGDGAAAFGTVDRVVQGGHDPRRFAADLLDRLRDLIILAAVPGAGQTGLLDAPADRLETMAGQAGRFGQAELARSAEIISDGLIQMRGTTSPRLLLELMCAQVLLPGASTGEKALLTRLERVERRLDAPVPAEGAGASRPAPARERPAGGGRAIAPAERQAAARVDPARPAPTAESPAAGAPVQPDGPSRAGVIDADTLRQHWAEVLDEVKRERKVAWILLSPASVESLEGGVLTVAFPREGEAKGFATSGHDQVLTAVLHTMLGLNVRVRGVVGSAPVPGGPARSATPRGPEHSGSGTTGAAGAAPGSPEDADGPSEPESPPGAGGRPGKPTATSRARRTQPDADGLESNEVPAPRGADAPRAPAPDGKQAPGRAGAAGSGGASSGRAGSRRTPPAAQGAGQAEQGADPDGEEWPDDAGEPGAEAVPTGMELIERQLGGRVIEEIDEP
jgi:DNA polymerase III subunit gamma/tau